VFGGGGVLPSCGPIAGHLSSSPQQLLLPHFAIHRWLRWTRAHATWSARGCCGSRCGSCTAGASCRPTPTGATFCTTRRRGASTLSTLAQPRNTQRGVLCVCVALCVCVCVCRFVCVCVCVCGPCAAFADTLIPCLPTLPSRSPPTKHTRTALWTTTCAWCTRVRSATGRAWWT
jgi:hypothetical protein